MGTKRRVGNNRVGLALLFSSLLALSVAGCGSTTGGGGNAAGGGDTTGGNTTGGDTTEAGGTLAGGNTENGGKKSISGVIQKGPFAKGTIITIQSLDDELKPVGSPLTTETTDDSGKFELSAEIDSPYVEISATGNYFDEVSGQMTQSPLSLKAIADLSSGNTININILTTLQCEKLTQLVQDGMSFEEAEAQTEETIVEKLVKKFSIGMDGSSDDFKKLDISKQGKANASLLTMSSMVQQLALSESLSKGTDSVKELEAMLSSLSKDIEEDGDLDDISLMDKMMKASKQLKPKKIKYFLEKKYNKSKSGEEEEISIPDIEEFIVPDTTADSSCETDVAEASELAPEESMPESSSDTGFDIVAALTPEESTLLDSVLHKDFPYAILQSAAPKYTQWVQIATLPNYGVLVPLANEDFSLFSTGKALSPAEWGDLDLYPYGAKGDLSGMVLEFLVPESATSLSFDFEFLSYEYPEYVGSVFNDYFAAYLTTSDGIKQISFDPLGNPININNVFFDASLSLEGTGFEFGYPAGHDAARTGRLKTIVPVEKYQGEVVRLEFVVSDVGDGIFTSTVVLDNLLVGPYYQVDSLITLNTPSTTEDELKIVPPEGEPCSVPEPVIQAYAEIMPRVLNLKSEGKFVQISLEIMEGGVIGEDFNLESIRITHVGETQVDLALEKAVKVSNDDEGADLLLKFSRKEIQEVIDLLAIEEGNIKTLIPLIIDGKLNNGDPFTATAQAKVIHPGDADALNKKKE